MSDEDWHQRLDPGVDSCPDRNANDNPEEQLVTHHADSTTDCKRFMSLILPDIATVS
jgi:hypothetical protein